MFTTHTPLVVLIAAMSLGLSSALLAEQDCAATEHESQPTSTTGPDCTLSWIDKNQLQTLTWQAAQEDFQRAVLEQGLDGTTLTSSQQPELIDVDQNGWLDLVTFTPEGMVNGRFDIFFYDPAEGFSTQASPLFGHSLARDRDGYVVVASRKGPRTIFRFFKAADRRLTFQFEIDPYASEPAQAESGSTCKISATSSADGVEQSEAPLGAIPENPEMLNYYCSPQSAPARDRRDSNLAEDKAATDRVPSGTVFYCQLEGGTHKVNILQDATGFRYIYGTLRGEPELVLERQTREVAILPENGIGPTRFGEISFENTPYTYTGYYSYELPDTEETPSSSNAKNAPVRVTVTRGLVVTTDGNRVRPVFEKECLSDHAYDAIGALRRR